MRGGLLAALAIGVTVGCGSEATAPTNATPLDFPLLPNNGGHVLSPMRIVAIATAGDSLADSLFLFANALPNSNWWRTVGQPFGLISIPTVVTVTGPALTGTGLTSPTLQAYITGVIDSTPSLAPDANTLYLLFLPQGATLFAPFGGYHTAFYPYSAANPAAWAVVQHSFGYQSVLEGISTTASHEIIEAATDPGGNSTGWLLRGAAQPWSSSPWAYSDGGGNTSEEAGDFCEGTRYLENGFYYQRIYSNAAVTAGGDPCVPAQSGPYFNASTSQAWYAAQTSGTVSVPMTGRSTAATSTWLVTATVVAHGTTTPTLAWSDPELVAAGSIGYDLLNTGRQAHLTVTFPNGGTHGDYAVILLASRPSTWLSQPTPAGADYYHLWSVGAYVP